MVKGSPCSACHIQLRSSFLFLLSFWLSSLTLSEEAGCQLEQKKKNKLSEPEIQESFLWKRTKLCVTARPPRVARRQPLSFVSGWSLGSEADISTQSASNRNNAPFLPKLTHLSSVIQLRAEPRWPSCCDLMCLHGRGGVYCGSCSPLLLDAHLATGEKELLWDLIYLSSLEESYNDSLTSIKIGSSWVPFPWDEWL